MLVLAVHFINLHLFLRPGYDIHYVLVSDFWVQRGHDVTRDAVNSVV